MRRIESEKPADTQKSIRRVLEEVQASTRSEGGRFQIHHYTQYNKPGVISEFEKKRLIEMDEEGQRSLNRALLMVFWNGRDRFFYIEDDGLKDQGVAYLADTRITGDGMGLFPPTLKVDEREKHNRILHEYDREIGVIEFFNVKNGIDLSGLTEAAKVERQLKDRVEVTIDPRGMKRKK